MMLTNFWDNKEADMLDLIEKIVNIDSGTFYKTGVEQVGDVLASAYQALGFQVAVDQQSERGIIWSLLILRSSTRTS